MSISPKAPHAPSAANTETKSEFEFDFIEPLDTNFALEMDLEPIEGESAEPLQELQLPMTHWTKALFDLDDAPVFPDMSEDLLSLGELLSDTQLVPGNSERTLLTDFSPIMSASPDTRLKMSIHDNHKTSDALNVVASIRKSRPKKPSSASYVLGARKSSNKKSSDVKTETEKRVGPEHGSKETEQHLQKHRITMRANRERINRKFTDLSDVLCACVWGTKNVRPMRNKSQVLDRAMELYPEMRARCALLRAELLLSTENNASVTTLLAATRPVQAAGEMLAHLLLGSQSWKAAEVWMRAIKELELVSAFASAQNVPTTKSKLHSFSAFAHQSKVRNSIVERSAALPMSLWVPDLRKIANSVTQADRATVAGISTAMYIPLAHGTDGLATAVLVMYHADDVLMAYPGGVRPFKLEDIANADELAAVIKLNNRPNKK